MIIVKDGRRLTFDLDSVRMFSTLIFETRFSYDNDMWTAATDNYLHQGIMFMHVCIFVCLVCVSAGLGKYH